MTPKRFIFTMGFLFFGVSFAWAEPYCLFDGVWDLGKKELDVTVTLKHKRVINIRAIETSPRIFDFYIDLDRLNVLLFDTMARITGTAKADVVLGGLSAIRGTLGNENKEFPSGEASHAVRGKFEITKDRVSFEDCQWAGLTLNGTCSLASPYQADLVVRGQNVLLSDLFSWLGQGRLAAEGELSGEIHFSGFSELLAMKGRLFSKGEIGDFRYDNITVNFDGFYPVVKLINTSVTQEGGVSFFLEGSVDLSKDFKNFSEQLAKMKILPLIRQTDVDREWTIRRETEGRKDGETEFKYRLRRDREVSGIGEGGMLTIERSLKF